MMCDNCGFIAECQHCATSYTYHRGEEKLLCHLCGDERASYQSCPKCGDHNIKYSGLGTEKIESIVNALFPDARVARMDADTMGRKNSYEFILNKFRRGEIDILIGTQMIAKGLHFPNVTLVGVVNADTSLYITDFRSEERTYQLLTQVSGRAGRGDIQGLVVIQTHTPFNPAIQATITNDFKRFFEEEIDVREQLQYPPAGELHVIHFRGEDEIKVIEIGSQFRDWLNELVGDKMVISPLLPAPIEKINKKYRYQITIRGERVKGFRSKLKYLIFHIKRTRAVEIYIDIDAINLQ
jgi:primosomal protein N' (replication factor Y)